MIQKNNDSKKSIKIKEDSSENIFWGHISITIFVLLLIIFKYISLIHFSLTLHIWEKLYCAGLLISFAISLEVYLFVYRKKYHTSLDSALVSYYLLVISLIFSIFTMLFSLFFIGVNFYGHFISLLLYIIVFCIWDVVIMRSKYRLIKLYNQFVTYTKKWFLYNDLISLIGISLVFAILISSEASVLVKINNKNFHLYEIMLGGVIGFQMTMSAYLMFIDLLKEFLKKKHKKNWLFQKMYNWLFKPTEV